MQETHACFFSLIRDVICSTPDHRMSLATLEDQLKAWQENPISPLNDWYCRAADSWLLMLSSAISFLSGDFPGVWIIHTHVELIYRRSNKTDYNTFHGISLLSTSYKVLCNILLSRLYPYVDKCCHYLEVVWHEDLGFGWPTEFICFT
jgi:hypothetical protein